MRVVIEYPIWKEKKGNFFVCEIIINYYDSQKIVGMGKSIFEL